MQIPIQNYLFGIKLFKITVFRIVVSGGKLSVLWSEISFYGNASVEP